MGYFVGELEIKPIGSKYWKTINDLLYVTNKGFRIIIPKGFEADGASIPRGLWSIIGHPLNGKVIKAAIVHDYLYATHKMTKEEADNLFLTIMKEQKVSYIRRYAMYFAVRLFGKTAYGKEPRLKS